jgi:hypothetical protein
MDRPSNRNERPSTRSTGDSSGARNRSVMAGVSSHTRPKQTAPTATPAADAARMSSSVSVGFCTSADASPIRTKNCANSTTSWASAMRPNATGSSSREIVAV